MDDLVMMLPNIINITIFMTIFGAICAGVIWLQIVLSQNKNRWLGLILPIFSFGVSAFWALGILLFSVSQAEVHEARLISDIAVVESQWGSIHDALEIHEQMLLPQVRDGHGETADEIAARQDRLEWIYSNMQETPSVTARVIITRSILVILAFNIPTAVFLVIYVVCRGKRNRLRAVQKMSVLDL